MPNKKKIKESQQEEMKKNTIQAGVQNKKSKDDIKDAEKFSSDHDMEDDREDDREAELNLEEDIMESIKCALVEAAKIRSNKKIDSEALDQLSKVIFQCLNESHKFVTEDNDINVQALMKKSSFSHLGGFIL